VSPAEGNRLISRGPPPLPSIPAGNGPIVIANGETKSIATADGSETLQTMITASIAPLLKKQQELEARLDLESAERARLRAELRDLQLKSAATPSGPEAVPDMFNGRRRRRMVAIGMLVFVGLLLASLLTATLLSQGR
jgi:hypothetical protein